MSIAGKRIETMTDSPILVAGLARCGTSLVMQMLNAAGVPCLGSYPDFEPQCVSLSRDVGALLNLRNVAFKIIDPELHEPEWPKFDAKIIWLNRDPKEQAKSQVKMVRAMGGLTIPIGAWREVKKALIEDKHKCCRWWNRCTSEPLFLSFEDLVDLPLKTAFSITKYLGIDDGKAMAMAACAIPRDSRCAPDMSIEIGQIERSR